jgi:hypothetical protein
VPPNYPVYLVTFGNHHTVPKTYVAANGEKAAMDILRHDRPNWFFSWTEAKRIAWMKLKLCLNVTATEEGIVYEANP